MKNLYCYDNEIIKWIYGDNLYCLHIQHDDEADNNPRWWDDHDSTMACFHSRYNLGDKIDEKTPEEFWNDLVYKYCSDEEILDALLNMKLEDTCVVVDENYIDEKRYAICDIGILSDKKVSENPMCVGLKYNEIITYVRGDFSIKDCQILLEKHIAWLPLWLHDHSGLSMDCDTRFRGSWDDSVLQCMVQGGMSCCFPTILRRFFDPCTAREYKRAQKQTPLSAPVLLPQNLNTSYIVPLK